LGSNDPSPARLGDSVAAIPIKPRLIWYLLRRDRDHFSQVWNLIFYTRRL
jgi:hypothetical protein